MVCSALTKPCSVWCLPEGYKTSDIAKAAGAKFKELSEAKKKAYQEKYEAKAMEYKKAMEDYKASLPEQSEEQPESASPSPQMTFELVPNWS